MKMEIQKSILKVRQSDYAISIVRANPKVCQSLKIINLLKMKKLLVLFLLCLPLMGKSQNGTTFEFENRIFPDKRCENKLYIPQVNVLSSFKITDKVGGYAYAQVNQFWATAYGGLSFNLAKWLTVQVGIGSETDSLPLRVNGNLIFTFGNFSSVQVYEFGGSGFYCNVVTGVKLSQWSTGFIIKTYYGIGPYVSYSIKKTPIVLLVAPFYDPSPEGAGYNVMGTLQFNLY